MPALSYYMHNRLVNWMKGASFGFPPTGLRFGLLTVEPSANGQGVVEPQSSMGYARQPITLTDIEQANGISSVKNVQPLVFGPATGNWPALTWGAIFDQDGNLLLHGALAASRVAPTGDSISFGAGAIQFRLK
ncbi:hypothetical protein PAPPERLAPAPP_02480 [Brevundimonas phage vB_BpoS-Papperlapapp]|uniref:Uncharacterized protein n=2 Tax=Marchewkavirus TaxID=3425052 RepID=A0A9E7MNH4_9CAUD|nr:hypothetical protein KABACHOK_00850 [Brevundimonas phage vB_BpoS-Kabachok]USN14618.1 hypothetical protein DOMOVOI_01440 [Brevundimonas phage vB_BpoS-Domovoi]USN15989.1 hypothetical protein PAPPERLAPAPP_02480 [Brevundimonas phage vB_BpoS-Papperlapapp]